MVSLAPKVSEACEIFLSAPIALPSVTAATATPAVGGAETVGEGAGIVSGVRGASFLLHALSARMTAAARPRMYFFAWDFSFV